MKLRHRLTTNHITLALATVAMGLAAWPYLSVPAAVAEDDAAHDGTFDTLTAQRINIVDPDGTVRLAITNKANPPELRYRGEIYPKRSIDDVAGIVFYKDNGDEVGGIAVARLGDKDQSALIFDYNYQLTDGIGIIKQEAQDGSGWKSGFFISDRRAYAPGTITSSQGVERIWLANEDKTASLEITDPEGRPRIRIAVDSEGEPVIEILDENGSPTFRAVEDEQ
ncbi:MAG: hypothetical protein AAFX04_01510 [Pseudomonadota bacterium]